MAQDERWWKMLKATRKKMNAGELKADRVALFQKLLELVEKYKRVNQYQ